MQWVLQARSGVARASSWPGGGPPASQRGGRLPGHRGSHARGCANGPRRTGRPGGHAGPPVASDSC
eukprot:11400110-Alexandrium_andersonii.AAC.1